MLNTSGKAGLGSPEKWTKVELQGGSKVQVSSQRSTTKRIVINFVVGEYDRRNSISR